MSIITPQANLQPRSILHYWLQLTSSPNQDFIQLSDYLNIKDLTVLDSAISELSLRHLYLLQLREYYSKHVIVINGGHPPLTFKSSTLQCTKQLEWIVARKLDTCIEKLNLQENVVVEDLIRLKIQFLNLQEIESLYVSKVLIQNIAWNSPNLTSFAADTAFQIDDECMDLLCQGCPNLKTINLSERTSIDNLSKLTYKAITTYCTTLEELTLMNLSHISNTGLSYLSNIHSLKKFVLTSSLCGIVVPYDTRPMIRSNHSLEQLKLHCLNMSHTDIFTCVGENCPLLKHIDMHERSWVGITDESVRIMTLGCPLLESLQISVRYSLYDDAEEADYNPHPFLSFTNTALYTIATNCIYFKYLHIDSPDALPYNEVGLDVLIDKCIHLRAIYNHNGIEQTSYLYYTAPGYNEREVELYIPTYKGGTKYHTQKGPYKINY